MTKKNGYTSKPQYDFQISNKNISLQLEKYGVVQNKTLILKFPYFLDDKLYSHFIRGVFDGDGYISPYFEKNTGYFHPILGITSTLDMCSGMKQIINNTIPSTGGSFIDIPYSKENIKKLLFSGRKQIKNILDYLYNDAELFLKRKHDIYLEYFN